MESSPDAGRSGEEDGAPKAVYTTAGTLYNPKATQPMQAPNRRGRTKWAQSGVPSSELSLLPKSALANLQMRGLLRTDHAPVPEYSPLQQNTDRAVSPSRRKELLEDISLNITASPAERRSERGPRPFTFIKPVIFDGSNKRMSAPKPVVPTAPASVSVTASTMVKTMTTTTTTTMATTTVQPPKDEEGSDGVEYSDSDLDNPLRGLSVKSLHNLASYPNPNQKRAQKALMGGCPMSNGGAPMPPVDDQTKSRPMTPNMTAAPPGFSLPENTPRQPADPKPSAYYTQISRYNSADALYRTSDGSQGLGGGYKSTLAKGPGAPEPLTAGPPGQRQHKASQIEKSIQDTSRTPVPSDEIADMPGYDGPMTDPSQAARPREQNDRGKGREIVPNSFPPGLDPRKPDYPYPLVLYPDPEPEFNRTSEVLLELRHGTQLEAKRTFNPKASLSGHSGQIPVYDTKECNDVAKYYPGGLPHSVGFAKPDPNWMQRDHAEVRPPWTPGTYMNNAVSMEKRNQRSLQRFCAGYAQFGGDMDHIIKEADRRQNPSSLGAISDGRPKPTPAPPKKMTIEEVNAMPKSEAVKPILNMAFSTLVRHIEEAENKKMALLREQAEAEAKAKKDQASPSAASGKGVFGKSSMS
jgi:hypothetical protein